LANNSNFIINLILFIGVLLIIIMLFITSWYFFDIPGKLKSTSNNEKILENVVTLNDAGGFSVRSDFWDDYDIPQEIAISLLNNDVGFWNETNVSDFTYNKTNIDLIILNNISDLNISNYVTIISLNNNLTYIFDIANNNYTTIYAYIGSIGNWSDDKIYYWNTSNILSVNVNITTTGNISGDYGFFSSIGSSISRTVDGWFNYINANYVNASILMNYLNSAKYTTLQNWSDTTQSAGWISGGNFTDNGDGSLNVSAGTGIIKLTNSEIGKNYFFNWDENSSVSLTDDTTNYIYIDINGGTPKIKVTLVKSDVNGRTKIGIGQIFREGNNLHMIKAGMIITDIPRKILSRFNSVDGDVIRASGYIVSETGERYLTTTNGVLFGGYTRLTTASIDTSGADSFEIYYRNGTGGWYEHHNKQINNTYWDDGTGTLNTLTSNRYGVFWVYGDNDGHLMVVYGQGDYTLTLAEAIQPPISLPNHVSEFGFIAAKVIVQEGETNLYSVSDAYSTVFTPSGNVDHGETTGLIDDDHTQYLLTNGDRSLTGQWNYGNYNINGGGNFTTTGHITADGSLLYNVNYTDSNETPRVDALVTNNNTLFTLIGDMENLSLSDITSNIGNFSDENDTLVHVGDANKTLLYCGNITGSTSDLCNVVGGGGSSLTEIQYIGSDLNGTSGALNRNLSTTVKILIVDGFTWQNTTHYTTTPNTIIFLRPIWDDQTITVYS